MKKLKSASNLRKSITHKKGITLSNGNGGEFNIHVNESSVFVSANNLKNIILPEVTIGKITNVSDTICLLQRQKMESDHKIDLMNQNVIGNFFKINTQISDIKKKINSLRKESPIALSEQNLEKNVQKNTLHQIYLEEEITNLKDNIEILNKKIEYLDLKNKELIAISCGADGQIIE